MPTPLRKPTLAFLMPRCRFDSIRGTHKLAWSCCQAGYDVTLVVKTTNGSEYLGMHVVAANAPFENLLRSLLNLPGMLKQALALRADAYVAVNPDTLGLALLLLLCGKRVVYDTWEDFARRPELCTSIPAALRPLVAWAIVRCELLVARWADLVVVTQPHLLNVFGRRTLLIENAPLTTGPIIAESQRYDCRDPNACILQLIYVGVLSDARGLFRMLDLTLAVNERVPCSLTLVGWFANAATRETAQQHRGWPFVRVYEERSHAESLARIRNADIGLALLDDVADYATASANKLYEYMEAGLPFVASDFPRWRESVAGTPAGVFIDPRDAAAVAGAIVGMSDNREQRRAMGASGRQFIYQSFNWELLGSRFVHALPVRCRPVSEMGSVTEPTTTR